MALSRHDVFCEEGLASNFEQAVWARIFVIERGHLYLQNVLKKAQGPSSPSPERVYHEPV